VGSLDNITISLPNFNEKVIGNLNYYNLKLFILFNYLILLKN